MEWKLMPDGARSSLRALSANLGTSHQLLSYYLQRLDQRQGNDCTKNLSDTIGSSKFLDAIEKGWQLL